MMNSIFPIDSITSYHTVEKRESMKGKQKERKNYRLIDYREEFPHSLVRAG